MESSHSTRLVSQVTPELAPIVAANNDLAWSLYGELAAAAPASNLFFSPFSISVTLAMTYAGARGDTASEMQSVLNAQGDPAAYHAAFGALLSDLTGEHAGRGYQLYAADRLYADQAYSVDPAFQSLLADDYQASLANVPFNSDPDSARQTINGWVSSQTKATVPELFPAGAIDSQTRLVLTNALYFKANWAMGFEPKNTFVGTFHAPSGDVPVQMMTQHGTFSVLTTKLLSLVELDYQDRELSMLLLIPFDIDGLPALEAQLNQEFLNNAVIEAEAQPRDWQIEMPRFQLGTHYSLRSALTALGMPSAFDSAQADFTGIGPGLYLADVVHAAYVQVDESGTVAAAATGAVLATRGAAIYPIVADHPFLFVIRDKLTGSILFVGRVTDPS